MRPDLVIPDEAVPFIRYQRSRYKIEKIPDPEEVKRRYAAHVAEDFANMEPHLPERVDTILEVGCGLAAIEVFLKRKYPDARLELLDGDTVTREGGAGYSDKPDVYNSRALTELLLGANGVTVDRWIDIGCKDLLEADLIISMASLAYHYSFDTYNLEGFVICDLRRGPESKRIDAIKAGDGKVVFAGPKYDRCAWYHKRK